MLGCGNPSMLEVGSLRAASIVVSSELPAGEGWGYGEGTL